MVQARYFCMMTFEEQIGLLVVELQCLLTSCETEVVGGVVGGEDEIELVVTGLVIDSPIAVSVVING